jgi:IS1 family transposase
MGPENQIVGNGHCGHNQSHQLLLCKVCRRSFCERRGTVFFGCKTAPEKICQALAALAEGLSLRATARVFGVDKDTVCAWLKKAAAHSEQVSDYLMRNLDVPEVQLDELWTFVQKKEQNLSAWEKLHTEYGDTWVWIAFDPLYKLILAHVEGDREEAEAEALLQKVKSRLGSGLLPLFTSDGWRHYATALLKVFGRRVQPARRGNRGRFPKPLWVAVPGLVYGMVKKLRVGRWVVGVTQRVIYGTWGQVWARLSAVSQSRGLNTAFVERMNLTLRHSNRRLARKTPAFSKKREWLHYQLEMAIAYYHFVRPHRSLRQRLREPQATKGNGSPHCWQERTPALAVGLTDHVWTMHELLSFRVPVGSPP